jgi:hypothetical protein
MSTRKRVEHGKYFSGEAFMDKLRSWAGNVVWRPRAVHRPQDEQEICELVDTPEMPAPEAAFLIIFSLSGGILRLMGMGGTSLYRNFM